MLRRLRRGLATVLLAFVAVICSSAPTAHAQSGADEAAARTLFSEGRALAEKGQHAEACAKFEESLKLVYGIGTELNLADCLQRTGRTASAWAAFLNVVAKARAAGQTERVDVASRRAAALEPKLVRLIIDVKSPSSELEVLRDGSAVGRASWGVAIPVDPGEHRIEARAPGKRAWSKTVSVAANPAILKVEVPLLEDAPPQAPAAAAASERPAATPDASRDDGVKASSGNTQRTIAIAVAGAGLVGVGIGTVFGLKTNSKRKEADEICPNSPPDICPDKDADRYDLLMDEAEDSRTLAYVGFGAGGAALVTAAVLFFTAGTSSEQAAVQALPFAGAGSVGGVVRGTW